MNVGFVLGTASSYALRRSRIRLLPPHTGSLHALPKSLRHLPLWHFSTKLLCAAPERGLPSLLTAAFSQHFFRKTLFAAPTKGLPSLPIALLVHAGPA
jgi:hypothetical protein